MLTGTVAAEGVGELPKIYRVLTVGRGTTDTQTVEARVEL
jgi:hypothetical protein